jgi:uncharacterized protein
MNIKFLIPALVMTIGIWSIAKRHHAYSQAQSPVIMTEPKITTAQILPVEAKATIGAHVFDLEVARTPRQQEIGLMFRQHLPENRGMLFPVDPPKAIALWMKQTRIPLDVIYIRNGKIVKIDQNLPPCQTERCEIYASGGTIDAVIEVVGGTAAKLPIKIGDTVEVQRD